MRFLLKVNIPVESGNAAAKADQCRTASVPSIIDILEPLAGGAHRRRGRDARGL
jgi:hypothetical protein